ncbi:MAG: glycosyltransferase [Elusimicrobia bacterium]|nr:glycosyltransferase [Elusimicrobiota bacterium]
MSVCVTTRDRVEELDACLAALWASRVKPGAVAVSDDSTSEEALRRNRETAARYPGTTIVRGPRKGVCANRNNALRAAARGDLLSFVDDDIRLAPDFIELALARYAALPGANARAILSGVSRDERGGTLRAGRLTFRGFFGAAPARRLETVAIHAAVFPRALFDEELWDENIFFGYEDAELCLRALKRGYRIEHCPELAAFNFGADRSTLRGAGRGALSDYELHVAAARLYVGVKRHGTIFPDRVRLAAFLGVYAAQLAVHLTRKRSWGAFAEIVRRSRWTAALKEGA